MIIVFLNFVREIFVRRIMIAERKGKLKIIKRIEKWNIQIREFF